MKNHWLDEIRIREVVELLTTLLNDEFKNTQPEPKDWLKVIEELIDTLYADDIVVLDGLMRYEIVCDLDGFGLVEQLRLIEKN